MSQAPARGRQYGKGNGKNKGSENDPKELLKAGVFLLRREEAREAMRVLELAHKLDPENPITRSYFGLSLAMCRSGTKDALRLCEDAVRGGTFHPELYHNLGRVYLIAGDRRRARLAFLEGLKLDREDPELNQEMSAIGLRSHPPLSFLHRDHPFNKYLGMALKRLRLR